MITDKIIKISLININIRTIYPGKVTLIGVYPHCGIQFTSSVIQDIEVKGHDYFQCLINLRTELEKQNYYPLCNGARRNLICRGMLREASCGCSGYIAKMGKYLDTVDILDVFDYASPDLVVSLTEQKQYIDLYEKSLPAIISYAVESTYGIELISNTIRKKIIDKLCCHSNWQLLEKESIYNPRLHQEVDKLWFRFSNTLEPKQWNIDMKIDDYSIDILITLDNDLFRESFLQFLNEQLSLNGIVARLERI